MYCFYKQKESAIKERRKWKRFIPRALWGCGASLAVLIEQGGIFEGCLAPGYQMNSAWVGEPHAGGRLGTGSTSCGRLVYTVWLGKQVKGEAEETNE